MNKFSMPLMQQTCPLTPPDLVMLETAYLLISFLAHDHVKALQQLRHSGMYTA